MKILTIRNFLTIQEATIEIYPITILIGPQATGKSIIAKLIYIFNEFPRIAQEILWEMPQDENELEKKIKSKILEIFHKVFSLSPGQKWPLDMEISLSTKIGRLAFVVNPKDDTMEFILCEEHIKYIKNHFKNVVEFKKRKGLEKNHSLDFLTFIGKSLNETVLYQIINEIVFHNQSIDHELKSSLFIPAGRSYFSVVDINPYLSINETISDYFFMKFAAQYKDILRELEIGQKNRFSANKKAIKKDYFSLSIPNEIVDGEYIYNTELKKAFITHKNGLVCEIKNASSGEQEFLPLFLSILQRKNVNFIIEEPEAHLFPKSQIAVTRFLLSEKDKNSEILITTHSPYLLAAFNNLLYAGEIYEDLNDEKKKKLLQIIPQKCIICKNTFSAYYINDGRAIPIVDKETGLIQADIIDEASDDIDQEFEKIMDLEL